MLYDFSNEWSQGFWGRGSKGEHYDGEAMRYYNGFKVLQRNIDVIPVDRNFTPYRLIIAPSLRMIDDATANTASAEPLALLLMVKIC